MEEIDLRMAHGGTTLGDQFCGELREEIALVAGWARSVDLDVFLVKAERMQRVLSPTSSLRKAHGDLRDLRERIVDELEAREFLFVPARLVLYYSEPEKGWGDAVDHFPPAQFDIEESGKCLALGRHTACVMHLMRVLELGLNEVAATFGVSFAHSEWYTILNQLEGKIKDIGNDPNKPANWRAIQHFYADAIASFHVFRTAWRNYAMHAREKFGEEEAISIHDGVRRFTSTLSKGLTT